MPNLPQHRLHPTIPQQKTRSKIRQNQALQQYQQRFQEATIHLLQNKQQRRIENFIIQARNLSDNNSLWSSWSNTGICKP